MCKRAFGTNTVWVDGLQYGTTAANGSLVAYVQDANSNIVNATIHSSVVYNGLTYTVRYISSNAFENCSYLTSITIPNTIWDIGNEAFKNCNSLTSITIPNSDIGDYAFENCSSLISITIPDNIDIGDYAFKNCSSLTSITIPNNVSIGDGVFFNCSSLTSITIPNSVTSIGDSVFCSCSSLTSVTIPNSVTSIGEDAFRNCSSLTSVDIPNSVTSIGEEAFRNCSSLTSVTIGNSVTTIGSWAFRNCSSLTSVTIPNSVTSFGFGGGGVFAGCSSLTSVTLSNNITSLPSLNNVGFFEGCSSLTSIDIPNSVTSIGNEAFYNCSSLTSIDIPNSVTSIGNLAFGNCSSLTSVTIPNSVTSFGYGGGVFAGCSSLTSVTLSNNITSLPTAYEIYVYYGFFEGCSSLTSIDIPNSVTSIGEETFKNCSSLTSITIPNSVTSIGGYAFSGCSSLTSVTCLAENPPALSSGSSIFYNTPYDKSLIVPCSALNNYINSDWNSYYNFSADRIIGLGGYNIVANVNNSTFGSVTVENNCSTATATLTATANICYEFVSWNDGNTQNPRTINLTSDTTFSAIFEEREIENTIFNATIVEGQVYNQNGFNESETGTYVQNLQNYQGCDSTVILNLTVVTCEPYYEERTVTICAGERYIDMSLGVNVLAGVYTLQISDYPDCDSTLVLTVVERGGDTTIVATINPGETYTENGFNEDEHGMYTRNLQTPEGCDSTITLILCVNMSLLDVEETELSFYPNPTNSKITFNQAIERIELMDLAGKTLRTFRNESEINIEQLPAGVYYLRLTNNEKQTLRKLIKE